MKNRLPALVAVFLMIVVVLGTPTGAFGRNDQHMEEAVGFEGDPTGGVTGIMDIDGGGNGSAPAGIEGEPNDGSNVRLDRRTTHTYWAIVPCLPVSVFVWAVSHGLNAISSYEASR